MAEELEMLRIKCEENKVVSFDVFDTLVLRNVINSSDIFSVLEKAYSIEGFKGKRIEAEKKARDAKKGNEVNLVEIYSYMNLENHCVEDIMKKEISLELEFCVPNPFFTELLKNLDELEIVLIADTYLSVTVIESILNKCGISNYSKLYVSCESGKTKYNGELYKEVMDENNYNIDDWIHIGSNIQSDISSASKLGVKTYHYKSVLDRSGFRQTNNLSNSIIMAIVINKAYNGLHNNCYFYEFGQRVAAPIHYAIAKWIYDDLNNEDKIHFCSRDGYIIYKIFQKLQNLSNKKIETKYIYASRRAYLLPLLYNTNKHQFINAITKKTRFSQGVTLNTIFKSLEIDISDYESDLNRYDLYEFDELIDNNKRECVREFFNEFYDELGIIMTHERDLLIEYFEQEGMFDNAKNKIFDIGWRGSVQKTIHSLTGINTFGYYFGTTKLIHPEVLNRSRSFAFSLEYPSRIFNNVMMYEFIFTAPHNSVVKFKKVEDRVVPEFHEKDFEFFDQVNSMIEGILDIIDDFIVYDKYYENIDGSEFIEIIDDFIMRREFSDLNEFSMLHTNSGFHHTQDKYVKSFSEDYIINNKDEFYLEISNSLWRETFMVNGIENEEDFNIFKQQHLPGIDKMSAKKLKKRERVFKLGNIKRALKRPKLVTKYILYSMLYKRL